MNKNELKKFFLEETAETLNVVHITGQPVYRVIGFENTLVSTWDFIRHTNLPDGIWSISKADNDGGIYQLHINQSMLADNNKSAVWAASMLSMQIYLKTELDDKHI